MAFGTEQLSPTNKTRIANSLRKKLGPEYVSTRAGPSGGKLAYVEGWKTINIANDIFGFNGWASSVEHTVDFCDESAKGYGAYNPSVSLWAYLQQCA